MFINFCQIKDPTFEEKLLIDAYNLVEPYLDNYISKGIKTDEYGVEDKANLFWQEASEFESLVIYLTIIRQQIIRDILSCNRKTYLEYKEQFKLDCIKKHFSCFTIPFDVTPLYNLFGVGSPYGFDGIGYMAISEDNQLICNNNNIFEVQQNNP